MSLGLNEDPRLEAKYTGAYAPNKPLKEVQTFVTEQVGLPWRWAEACFDAGHRLQGVWHKIGIESARNDPFLDGFICWLTIDISPSSQNGVLNMFWEPKKSLPDDFRQFNAPTVILARNAATSEALSANPASVIHTEGDVLNVDWFVSHFQPEPLKEGRLVWQITADKQTLASGAMERVHVKAGEAAVVGRSRITMPAVAKAVKAKLIVSLDTTAATNSWDLWIFPKFRATPRRRQASGRFAAVVRVVGQAVSRVDEVGRREGRRRQGRDREELDRAGHARRPEPRQGRRLSSVARLSSLEAGACAWVGGK